MTRKLSYNSSMRVSRKAARADTRLTNRRLVLQQLFDGRVLSRADLAAATSLTPATISSLVRELSEESLISEAAAVDITPKVGKPPTLLKLNANAYSCIALDLSNPDDIRAAVVDLAGSVIASTSLPLNGARGDAAVSRIEEAAHRAIELATTPILGIGIGSPGIVSNGVIREATHYGWSQLNLAERLESATGFTAFVTNDATAFAIAEYSRGGHNTPHIVVIKIGSGVGAGLVLNGTTFEGESFGAGEIGHLVVDPTGEMCRCGHNGCLELYISTPRIEQAISQAEMKQHQVIALAAERLGVALASIVSVLDPGRIVIAGPSAFFGTEFCDLAEDSLKKNCLTRTDTDVEVQYTTLGEDGVLQGAASLVLSKKLGVA